MTGHHQQVIVAFVFVEDAFLHISIFHVLTAGIAAEEDHHLHFLVAAEQISKAL